MSIKILPIKKHTAAEIICNLSKISKLDLLMIKKTLNEFGMVYFRNQKLSSKDYLSFAKKIGKPAFYPRLKGLSKKYSISSLCSIFCVSVSLVAYVACRTVHWMMWIGSLMHKSMSIR